MPVYEELARGTNRRLDFSRAPGFALDEYVGLPGHPQSYREVIRREFTDRVNIDPANVHWPDGSAADIPAACDAYEEAIKAAGGVDLQLLGVGTDGHIGFNEPGLLLRLEDPDQKPDRTDPQGQRAVLHQPPGRSPPCAHPGAGHHHGRPAVILIATGAQKAQAVRDFVEGPVAAICAASVLQMHPHATVLVDEAAASSLRLADYYRHTYDNKPGWQGL